MGISGRRKILASYQHIPSREDLGWNESPFKDRTAHRPIYRYWKSVHLGALSPRAGHGGGPVAAPNW